MLNGKIDRSSHAFAARLADRFIQIRARLGKLDREESCAHKRRVDPVFQEGLRPGDRDLRRGARRRALLWLDRQPGARLRRIIVFAEIRTTQAEEWMVENQHAPRRAAVQGWSDEARGARANSGGQTRWTLDARLRFAGGREAPGGFFARTGEKQKSQSVLCRTRKAQQLCDHIPAADREKTRDPCGANEDYHRDAGEGRKVPSMILSEVQL